MANVKTVLISWAAAAIWLCAPARVQYAAGLDHCAEGTQLTCEWDDGFCTPPMKAREAGISMPSLKGIDRGRVYESLADNDDTPVTQPARRRQR